MQIQEEEHGKDHPSVALVMESLAVVLGQRGLFVEQSRLQDRALDIFEHTPLREVQCIAACERLVAFPAATCDSGLRRSGTRRPLRWEVATDSLLAQVDEDAEV